MKLLFSSAHSTDECLKTYRGLFSLVLVLVAFVSLIQAKPTLHAVFQGDSNEVELTCRSGVDVVLDALFTFGDPVSISVTGEGNSLTVVITPQNETEVRCSDGELSASDILYLFGK